MDNPVLSFQEFKSEYSFQQPAEDYFLDELHLGCNETEFEKWLKSQRLFIKRFGQLDVPLNDVHLPVKKWFFFTSHFERVKRTQYLTSTFPEGFFEAIGENGEVACLLPDTYGNEPYRISYYRENGPTYHETFSNRSEALTKLANGRFVAKEGALDELLHTPKWDRGLQVAIWLSEGIHPTKGLKRDKHLPEVQRLFASELSA